MKFLWNASCPFVAKPLLRHQQILMRTHHRSSLIASDQIGSTHSTLRSHCISVGIEDPSSAFLHIFHQRRNAFIVKSCPVSIPNSRLILGRLVANARIWR
ncbi:hypothetical protein CEXT_307571 [Caerostris extrusa]|uniref:Uncharacterized protein n=1 Tax=Caerostris extrusa TaxID=172846 RepID=A0AAV4VSI5_CAEEX|nr:hypothetical protein CEXT_307571 [Caerostris extrusa]